MKAALLPNIMSQLIMLALTLLYELMWPHYEYADRFQVVKQVLTCPQNHLNVDFYCVVWRTSLSSPNGSCHKILP